MSIKRYAIGPGDILNDKEAVAANNRSALLVRDRSALDDAVESTPLRILSICDIPRLQNEEISDLTPEDLAGIWTERMPQCPIGLLQDVFEILSKEELELSEEKYKVLFCSNNDSVQGKTPKCWLVNGLNILRYHLGPIYELLIRRSVRIISNGNYQVKMPFLGENTEWIDVNAKDLLNLNEGSRGRHEILDAAYLKFIGILKDQKADWEKVPRGRDYVMLENILSPDAYEKSVHRNSGISNTMHHLRQAKEQGWAISVSMKKGSELHAWYVFDYDNEHILLKDPARREVKKMKMRDFCSSYHRLRFHMFNYSAIVEELKK